MTHKNMKKNVYSFDGDTNFFDSIDGFYQGYITYMYIIFLDYQLNENGFVFKRQKAEKMINVDYGDDLALLSNTFIQGKCQLHSLELATRGIE